MSMEFFGSWFRKPFVTNGESSARWDLGHMSISSHCSSLKTQVIQMSTLFPRRWTGVYFGKGAYFKLKDRGSLTCCCASFISTLHSAKIKYSLNNR